jgi:hypothetical protein
VPIAKGPRCIYMGTISSEPCERGFKATVFRVVFLTGPDAGTEVAHEVFPEHVAESKQKAERMAEAYFKAWAKIQRLGGAR